MFTANFFTPDVKVTLTASEELAALKSYKLYNDLTARDRVIFGTMSSALKRAEYICRRYENIDIDDLKQDLKQEVYLALYDAIEHFDCEKGMRFFTLAYFYIDKYVKRYLGIEVDNATHYDSLDDSYYNDDEECETVADHTPCPEEDLDLNNVYETLLLSMRDDLSEREFQMVSMQFGIGTDKVKVKDIADQFSVSTECVRLAKVHALQVLAQDQRVVDLLAA